MGQEAASQGVDVLLGPGLCIKRNPLCGRNFEYFSEDPYLAGKMAAGYVRGIQSNGIAACPKHFAVNSQETRRQASDSILDERTLREIYLTAFEIVVREAQPKTIMSSYNLINGTYANENAHLLDDILRKEWGFDGSVVTDWGGSNDHAAGVAAGSTFEMPAPGLGSVRELLDAVAAGTLSEKDIDARVDEVIDLVLSVHPATLAAPRAGPRGRRGRRRPAQERGDRRWRPAAAACRGHQGRPHRRLCPDPALPGRRLLGRQLHQGGLPAGHGRRDRPHPRGLRAGLRAPRRPEHQQARRCPGARAPRRRRPSRPGP